MNNYYYKLENRLNIEIEHFANKLEDIEDRIYYLKRQKGIINFFKNLKRVKDIKRQRERVSNVLLDKKAQLITLYREA